MSYRNKNQNIDLDFRKFVAIVATLLLFFVLPISVINQNIPRNVEPVSEETEGRVAGVSTSETSESISTTQSELNLETLFLTLGILFTGTSIVLATYFVVSSLKIQKFKP